MIVPRLIVISVNLIKRPEGQKAQLVNKVGWLMSINDEEYEAACYAAGLIEAVGDGWELFGSARVLTITRENIQEALQNIIDPATDDGTRTFQGLPSLHKPE